MANWIKKMNKKIIIREVVRSCLAFTWQALCETVNTMIRKHMQLEIENNNKITLTF